MPYGVRINGTPDRYDGRTGAYVKTEKLDFISVGVVRVDPTDIEYRYLVVCGTDDGRGNPRVLVDSLDGNAPVSLADALTAEPA